MFPGTFEKLVEKGINSVELEEFDLAVEAFDQAIVYEPDNPEFWVHTQSPFMKQKTFAVRKI